MLSLWCEDLGFTFPYWDKGTRITSIYYVQSWTNISTERNSTLVMYQTTYFCVRTFFFFWSRGYFLFIVTWQGLILD